MCLGEASEWSEGEALEYNGFGVEVEEDEEEIRAREEVRELAWEERRDLMQKKYGENKGESIGSLIGCPVCNKFFIKKTRDHSFCSNGRKVRGRSSCKDKYWNLVSERKALWTSSR